MKTGLTLVLISAAALMPALASAKMMGYYGWSMMSGWGIFGLIINVVFWALIIWAVIALVRWAARGQKDMRHWRDEDSAVRILKERYAKGEINKQEFEEKMKDVR